ncbi:MAG: right-handed parallel beta-helix repeat-containing protein [Chthoniobacteraceae bacterium]
MHPLESFKYQHHVMLHRFCRILLIGLTLFTTDATVVADGPFDGAQLRLYGDPVADELTHIEGGLTDRDGLRLRLDAISLPSDLSHVVSDLTLPVKTGDGYTLRWWSSDIETITPAGKVTRPRSMLSDAEVLLKVFIRKGDIEVDRSFRVTVVREPSSPAREPQPKLEPVQADSEAAEIIAGHWGNDFSPIKLPVQTLDFVVHIAPGESVQAAIDKVKAHGGGVVALEAGVYPLTASIVVCDRLTLVGAGRDYTLLKKSANFADTTIRHAGGAVRDLVLKDFTLDGEGRAGIGVNFSSNSDDPAAQGDRILLQNVTIKNVFDHGLHTKRVSNLALDRVHIMYNGNHLELFHNIYLLGINNLLISGCNFSSPVGGKCLKLTRVKNGLVQRTEFCDGLLNGVQIDDASRHVMFDRCHFENLGRTALWFICERFGATATRYTSDAQYAPQHVIISHCSVIGNTRGAVFKDVRDILILNSEFRNRENDIITLRCSDQVNCDSATRLSKPAAHFTVPEDVPIL